MSLCGPGHKIQVINIKDSDNRAREQGIRVLLLDTPENEGVDFLQKLSQQSVELVSQRLGSHQALSDALEKDSWYILQLNDRLASLTTEEILDVFRQTRSETGLVVLILQNDIRPENESAKRQCGVNDEVTGTIQVRAKFCDLVQAAGHIAIKGVRDFCENCQEKESRRILGKGQVQQDR